MMSINPMQLMAMFNNGGNPQQLAMMMLNQMGNNPMTQNLRAMVQNNDTQGIETFARNLAKERGINPDQALPQMMQQFGR